MASFLFPFSMDSSLSVATTRLYISITLKPSVSTAGGTDKEEEDEEEEGPTNVEVGTERVGQGMS